MWRAEPDCGGRGRAVVGWAWALRAEPGCGGRGLAAEAGARRQATLISLISSRAPEVAVLRGGAPGRPRAGRWPGVQVPRGGDAERRAR